MMENWRNHNGPWSDEPDYLEFNHLGFLCILKRNLSFGNWCGYVRVPNYHQWSILKEAGIDDPVSNSIRVHGGVTYIGPCFEDDSDHKLIGFDCAHGGDLLPLTQKDRWRHHTSWETYKDIKFVTSEVKNLAIQACQAGVLVYINGNLTILTFNWDVTSRAIDEWLMKELRPVGLEE